MRLVGVILVIVAFLIIYALCKASSWDDRERERMAREWEDKT